MNITERTGLDTREPISLANIFLSYLELGLTAFVFTILQKLKGEVQKNARLTEEEMNMMKDDWMQLPRVFNISRHTMNLVRINFGFTIAYNLAGLTLAAFGILPPILGAAAQSLPDLGILGNSSRLLRQK